MLCDVVCEFIVRFMQLLGCISLTVFIETLMSSNNKTK